MSQAETRSTFSYFASQLKAAHPSLAYLHLTTSRVGGGSDQVGGQDETLDFLVRSLALLLDPSLTTRQYDIWSPKPILIAGTFTADEAKAEAEKKKNVVVAYGRYFISNVSPSTLSPHSSLTQFAVQPDLPEKIRNNVPFTPYNRKTFYSKGPVGTSPSPPSPPRTDRSSQVTSTTLLPVPLVNSRSHRLLEICPKEIPFSFSLSMFSIKVSKSPTLLNKTSSIT